MNNSAVRDRIMEVASRLFYEQGYNNTGINQVIEEADIARASLYHHFPSKSALLDAYLREAGERWFTNVDKLLSTIKDPRKKIAALFDYRIGRQVTTKFGGCQFIKISAEVPKDDQRVFELVGRHKERVRTYIRDIVTQIKPNNTLLSATMRADAIFLLMEGATVAATISKDSQAMISAKKIAEKLI